ncbi:immunoglobulin kappa light chain-like [Scyliorhinus canicula]|uniref:immunoglobulin kappa light chain-like n=1 Tax=Scyliorhinus canicula TaxID=7830 RepID=UPI0018F7AA72|nr:immunoglobulin kappa light chain-like [Scyliorhinus canicula]
MGMMKFRDGTVKTNRRRGLSDVRVGLVPCSGLSADPVTQSPVTKTVSEGGSVRLDCEYTDSSMRYMQWYQQKAAQPPIWLITNVLALKKDEVSVRYLAAADKSKQNGYLNISGLSVDDGAVYYCAMRHSVRKPLVSSTKTSAGGLCADPVTQLPVTITASEGDSAQFYCEYTDKNMYDMQWYQQKPTQQPRWIITNTLALKKVAFSGRYLAVADKSKQNGYLNISTLSVEDGAVYYCAMRHSVREQLEHRTKTSASMYSFTKFPSARRI